MHEPRENDTSPWGTILSVEEWADGIWSIRTASHGGLKLSEARNTAMPDYLRIEDGWYEQDKDWCLAVVAHHKEFRGHHVPKLDIAMDTMLKHHPRCYEKFFGIELGPVQKTLF